MKMELIVIPTIMVISYLVTEIFKLFIKKKFLPVIAGITGAVLGVIAYFFTPSLIKHTNLLTSIAIGIISGLAVTGSNQLIKQIKKKG
jgi:hypothetical protein